MSLIIKTNKTLNLVLFLLFNLYIVFATWQNNWDFNAYSITCTNQYLCINSNYNVSSEFCSRHPNLCEKHFLLPNEKVETSGYKWVQAQPLVLLFCICIWGLYSFRWRKNG